MPRLEFTHRHRYASQTEGIALPVILKSGAEAVDVLASVDTGASNCLFEREHGDMLDIGVETGEPRHSGRLTGASKLSVTWWRSNLLD